MTDDPHPESHSWKPVAPQAHVQGRTPGNAAYGGVAASHGSTYATLDLYRLLIHSVRDYAIFVLDPGGHIASWNTGAQRMKGYDAEEILGRHFSVFYPEEQIASGKPEHELEVAARVGRFEDEGWRKRKDGSLFWANVVLTAMRSPEGELIGFAKITRDLTERRAALERALADARRIAVEETARAAAEEQARDLAGLTAQLRVQSAELERRGREAETANRAKADFLAAMSHELRTPLNAIAGYTDLLLLGLRGAVNEEQRSDLERIRRSQQHLLAIINDILNFSRIDAGQIAYDIAPVAVEEVFEAVAAMIAPQAAAKGLRYAQEPSRARVVVRADRAKVEQILLNLLSNAVKFTERGGFVTLACRVVGSLVTVSVRDTGRGIQRGKIDTIFEPFVQVGRSLTKPGEGTGLGLAISRDLARAMGGDLAVESVEGVGSLFTLTLPLAE